MHPSRHRQRDGRWRHTYAALDLGTNNCRLLIAKPAREGFRVIDAFSRIVRLGEGLDGGGRLTTAAMDRTIDALVVCAWKMRHRGVDRVRSVATEACRQAENCNEFLARVETETGLEIETITSAEEARLALRGCMPLLDDAKPRALVFDIGGGSTELVWLDVTRGEPDMIGLLSIPYGVVNVSERHAAREMNGDDYRAIVAEVGDRISQFCLRHKIGEAVRRDEVQMLGTSGTVTTLAGVHLDLRRYDRSQVDGVYLDFAEARAVSARLREMDHASRVAHPCIGVERADLVVAGCAVLEAILDRWAVGRLRVADRGLREGILLELMEQADRDGRRRVGAVDGAR
jgi:exopolyphosphatase/guanosine-5'-triphosphate,3'-diphosphate pyrophosphatase